jgi:hypothetical protein
MIQSNTHLGRVNDEICSLTYYTKRTVRAVPSMELQYVAQRQNGNMNQFHPEDPQILGATVQHSVVPAL